MDEVARGQGSQEINAMTVDVNNDVWVATPSKLV